MPANSWPTVSDMLKRWALPGKRPHQHAELDPGWNSQQQSSLKGFWKTLGFVCTPWVFEQTLEKLWLWICKVYIHYMVPNRFSPNKATLPAFWIFLDPSTGSKKHSVYQVNQDAKNLHQANGLHQSRQANNPEDFETWFAVRRRVIYHNIYYIYICVCYKIYVIYMLYIICYIYVIYIYMLYICYIYVIYMLYICYIYVVYMLYMCYIYIYMCSIYVINML